MSTSGDSSGDSLTTAEIFSAMNEAVQGANGKKLQKKFKGTVVFIIKDTGETWALDLKDGDGNFSCRKGDENMPKPDLYVTVQLDDMVGLVNKTLNPQQAFMKGKLKIKGKMNLAMKLTVIIAATRKAMPATSKL